MMITPPADNALLYYGFLVMSALMAVIVFLILQKHHSPWKVLLGLAVVLAIPTTLTLTQTLSRLDLTPPPSLLLPLYLILISTAAYKILKETADKLPLGLLVILQTMRIPIEYLLQYGANEGIVPTKLSLSGWNYDLFTGIGALVIGILLLTNRKVHLRVIWIWNLFGLACLAVIFFIAITTSPVLKVWGDDPSNINTWVLFWPYALLPFFLVVIAIASHLLITRKLILEK